LLVHRHYPNKVGKKLGVWHDGMVVLLVFKKDAKHAYLSKNLELVRLPRVRPGEMGVVQPCAIR